jgi:hypothetical protein
MSTKEKLVTDLKIVNQNEMATFIETNKDPTFDYLLNKAFEGKQYIVFCKTCHRVFVDMPFNEYYKYHTYPEWDLWFCDATLHWAETEGKHSIYCFSSERNYDISASNAYACRKETWKQIHRDMKDVVSMREGFMKLKRKNKVWIKENGAGLDR